MTSCTSGELVYHTSTWLFVDVPYTAIEWVAIEGEELRLEHPPYSKPEWVWHTVVRGYFCRSLGQKTRKEGIVTIRHTDPNAHIQPDPDPTGWALDF